MMKNDGKWWKMIKNRIIFFLISRIYLFVLSCLVSHLLIIIHEYCATIEKTIIEFDTYVWLISNSLTCNSIWYGWMNSLSMQYNVPHLYLLKRHFLLKFKYNWLNILSHVNLNWGRFHFIFFFFFCCCCEHSSKKNQRFEIIASKINCSANRLKQRSVLEIYSYLDRSHQLNTFFLLQNYGNGSSNWCDLSM